jgi:hypothetical protein
MIEQITQTENGYQVTIGGQVMSVPNDPANEDYQRVQEAIKGGMELTVPPVPTKAEALVAKRAAMVISPLQGILTLGETEWGKVLAYRDTATWAEKVVIDSAQDWQRNSQNIAFFGYLLGYTDEQMDALFIAAARVTH